MLETLLQLDGNILLWIQENLRNPILTALMVRITALGNAGMIWIVITALLLLRKDTRSAGIMSAMALAILIAFSRLYVGIHYPSDVLAGALTGIFAGMLARRLYAAGREKFSGRNGL
ncbi:MAG: phosphatase PAP2 family protein [Lachnospiraceae bacterium]|nr:phosphatase PAP2 family protein [Lachnospiraceae bacterium]